VLGKFKVSSFSVSSSGKLKQEGELEFNCLSDSVKRTNGVSAIGVASGSPMVLFTVPRTYEPVRVIDFSNLRKPKLISDHFYSSEADSTAFITPDGNV